MKENKPPDCIKPPAPSVKRNISVNDGDTVRLTASGVNGASYTWSGPHGFYSASANPVIINAGINQNGKYYAKAQVGYCFSDSVGTEVFIKTDTTCRLGDNGADFPNGSHGPFTLITHCAGISNDSFLLDAMNADSSILINAAFKTKPAHGGVYSITDNSNPQDNEVYVRIILTDLKASFYAKGATAYVRVNNSGQINLILCDINFKDLGVFSANIACK